jgi:maltose phosphorylase
MPKRAERYLAVDPWIVEEKGFHPRRGRVSESIFALANECMGVRGYFEEGYSGDTLRGCYFNGIFEEQPVAHPQAFNGLVTRTTFMVNAVDWLYVRIVLDGETLDLARSTVRAFRRRLDMRSGVLTRTLVWTTRKGKRLRVTFTRFVSMETPCLGAQRIVFEPLNFSGAVRIRTGLDFGALHEQDGPRCYWTLKRAAARGGVYAGLAETVGTRHRLVSGFRLDCAQRPVLRRVKESTFIGADFTLALQKGHATGFDKLVVHRAEPRRRPDNRALWAAGRALVRRHARGFDAALARHAAAWRRAWETLDIVIEGDPETQQGVRFSVFHLHQTYHGVDPRFNIGAKGLTGEAYAGVTWWDTETYCLPFYLFNDPRAARNLLEFRHRTLPGALRRAKELDCEGARYPMMTHVGTEVCGTWQHGDLEIHVSAAVAYGIRHYDRVCADKQFLYTKGIEMLLQISRYYASRGGWNPRTGAFGFWGVMGADEFHMMVHNNAYTNVMAQKSFVFTLRVISEMKRKAPRQLDAVFRRVGLGADEPRAWRRMARRMHVPRDPRSGLIEQHEGYFSMPHQDVASIPATDFPLYNTWAYVRLFRTDMIKQPDVLLLLFLFGSEYSARVKAANFAYYEPRCSHESSLSPCIHSIIAAELGLHDTALAYSRNSARLDLDDYNRNTHAGLHVTCMAGTWLNMVYGYGGMRSDGGTLAFKPSLPANWTAFGFRVRYRDRLLAVRVDRAQATLRVVDGTPLTLTVFDTQRRVGRRGMSVPLPRSRLARRARPTRAVAQSQVGLNRR